MNQILEKNSKEYGYIFVDIWDHYVDSDTGYLNRILANDIHLTPVFKKIGTPRLLEKTKCNTLLLLKGVQKGRVC